MITVVTNKDIHYRKELYNSISNYDNTFYYEERDKNNSYLNIFKSLKKTKKLLILRDVKSIKVFFIILYSKLNGYKIIVWGGWFTKNPLANLLRIIYSHVASKNIFYSNNIMLKFISKGIPSNKCSALPNNKYVESYKNVKNKVLELGFLGTLNERKKIKEFLEVLDLKLTNKINFHVIGNGIELENIKSSTFNHINIISYGKVTCTKKISKILSNISIIVSPGQIGLTIVDAFSTSTPVATLSNSISGGEKDSIIDGYNGIIENEMDSLADRIIELEENINTIYNLSIGAEETFKILYNWNNYINQFQ